MVFHPSEQGTLAGGPGFSRRDERAEGTGILAGKAKCEGLDAESEERVLRGDVYGPAREGNLDGAVRR
jgi:hypothetical protein